MAQAEWADLFTNDLAVVDPEIAELIAAQGRQNCATINLVASETYCPAAALTAETSELVNKNAGGYPPRLSFNGETMDAIERLAVARAKALFGAEHSNIQSLSATISNIAVLRALLRPGERIMGFDMAAGGHNSHGDAGHIYGLRCAALVSMTPRPSTTTARGGRRANFARMRSSPDRAVILGQSISAASPRLPPRSARCWSATSPMSPA